MEYEFVVNLYNYEVLNRYTDLVDSLEITAEQWDEMDEQLLFCHTNSAYCYLEVNTRRRAQHRAHTVSVLHSS